MDTLSLARVTAMGDSSNLSPPWISNWQSELCELSQHKHLSLRASALEKQAVTLPLPSALLCPVQPVAQAGKSEAPTEHVDRGLGGELGAHGHHILYGEAASPLLTYGDKSHYVHSGSF